MDYPITSSITVPRNHTVAVPFRPALAGLVKVICVATGDLSLPPPLPPGEDVPPGGTHPRNPFHGRALGLQVQILKPRGAAAATPTSGRQPLEVPILNRLVVWNDAMAEAADLGGDWLVMVTNTGDVKINCKVTVRYPTVAGNLGKIDHIVILMMENRSFDHMLGYLTVDGARSDVDGLTGSESNPDEHGTAYRVRPLPTTLFPVSPGHGWDDVDEQLAGGDDRGYARDGGFVRNFSRVLTREGITQVHTLHDRAEIDIGSSRTIRFRPGQPGLVKILSVPTHHPRTDSPYLARLVLRRPASANPLASATAAADKTFVSLSYLAIAADLAPAGDWTCQVINGADESLTFDTEITYALDFAGAIMGYYNAAQLPSYDVLAREFTVCDRWFASLPTDTWPNRLYALTGGSGGEITTPSAAQVRANPPGYTLRTIFEVLQECAVDWGIFFSDIPFALIFKRLVQDATFTERMRSIGEFLYRTETGDLPSVSWIDPNFTDVPESLAPDDDHPPGDVARGQQLVAQLYRAVSSGPAWSKTLLLITYDEHGGFYDHVRPPGTPQRMSPLTDRILGGPPDDLPNLRRYGVRVPAFVVSPWAGRGHVAKDIYDHTSLLQTILRRFCVGPGGDVPPLGARTDAARDVGPLLAADRPREETPTIRTMLLPPGAPRLAPAPTHFGAVLRKTLLGF